MQKIRRIGAGILGTIMAGASLLAPALAADLSEYPAPFVTDGDTNFLIVVGADADPADVVGAINIAVRLGAEPGEPVTVGAPGVSIVGGESGEVTLGGAITTEIESILDDADLTGLKDDRLTFDGKTSGSKTYDYHEEITLGNTKLKLQTSLTSDDDYGENIYLEVGRDDIKYNFVFDTNINLSAEVDSDHPLTITFLGDQIKITAVTANSITAEVGKQIDLSTGETTTVNGKTIKLVRATDTSVYVKVDGEPGVIDEGKTGSVGGLKIKVESAFGSTQTESGLAILMVGEEVSKTYSDGSAYIGEDENNPDWVWNIENLDTNNPTLGIENDFVKDDLTDNPITVGGSYTLPNNYASITFSSLTVKEDDYATYTISYQDNVDLSDAYSGETSEKVIAIESSDPEGLTNIYNATTEETNTMYLYYTGSALKVLYIDKDTNKVKEAGSVANNTIANIAKINYQDTTLDLNLSTPATFAADSSFNLSVESTLSSDDLVMVFGAENNAFAKLGTTASTEEASELTWNGNNIGTKDANLRTKYGIIVKNPSTNGAKDQVQFDVPAEQVKANIVVTGPGTTVTTAEGEVVKKVIPMAAPILDNGIAALDTDPEIESAKTNKNLILIGSPAVNRLTAQALDVPYKTYGYQWTADENLSAKVQIPGEGNAILQLVEDAFIEGKVALVVAGWSAADTQAACTVLQQYKKESYGRYDLSEDEFTVGATTVRVIR